MERHANGSDCVIELDGEWLRSMNDRLQGAGQRLRRTGPCTIFRVPHNIRKSDPRAYEPRAISLGPYHHGKKALKPMEEHKWRYLRKLLASNPDLRLEDYLKRIKALEGRARSHYCDDCQMSSDKFVETMVLDGCFVVQLLLMQLEEGPSAEDENDPITRSAWMLPLIQLDMIMLENQIPFFILQELFDLSLGPGPGPGPQKERKTSSSLLQLALDFLQDLLAEDLPSVASAEQSLGEPFHLLHLFHACILPDPDRAQPVANWSSYSSLYMIEFAMRSLCCSRRQRDEESSWTYHLESIPCATKLYEAGVILRKKESSNFLDVTFGVSNGVMEVSPLRVYDDSNALLRNLIALEQCYPRAGNHVSSYAMFMDCLVDTAADVALLRDRGLIVNGLGSDEEATVLFNRLCQEVAVDFRTSYLAGLFGDVNRFSSARVPKWRARLVHDYFGSPWAFFSLLAAVVLLLLTVTQTIYAILSYNLAS